MLRTRLPFLPFLCVIICFPFYLSTFLYLRNLIPFSFILFVRTLLLLVVPNFVNPHHFLDRAMWGSMRLLWRRCGLQCFVQAIVCWQSVIGTTCWATLTLGIGSSTGGSSVDVACLCRLASVLECSLLFFRCHEKVEHENDLSKLV